MYHKVLPLQCYNFSKYLLANNRTFVTVATADRIAEKVKGTILENWFKFWKNVFIDYREMIKDVRADIKQKPVKTALLLTGFGSLTLCSKLNPNEASFRANYIECANKLILVHPTCQNPQAVKHLKYIENCYNKRLIRRINLGIGSLIWVDRCSDECNTYESQCSYLDVKFTDFLNRILDFGFLNIWWNTSKHMLDYDINF